MCFSEQTLGQLIFFPLLFLAFDLRFDLLDNVLDAFLRNVIAVKRLGGMAALLKVPRT